MRRVAQPLFGLALYAWLFQAAVAEGVAQRSLPDLVLNLARLQDAAARGDAEAGALQMRMLSNVSAELMKADPLRLPDAPSLRAAIIYVLSGGRPSDVEVLLRATPDSEPLRWILRGAVQFATGEKAEALKTLTPFKPETLPASIGGRVALAMAALLPEGETVEKARLLEFAARQMPGTLVEEAALRRLAILAAAQDDPLQFQKTAERYVWRYSASLYAGGLMKDYVAQIVIFEAKHKPISRLAFEVLMNRLPAMQRCQAYLGVARQATSLGLADLALYASTRARRLAVQGSAEWSEATLYDAAILITGPDYDIARDLLREVNGSQLDAQGKAMLSSVETLAARMHADFDSAPAQKSAPDSRVLPLEQQVLSDKVSKAVAAADTMLQGLTP